MPRMLDLEPQILKTVEENPSTSTRQLAHEFQVSQFVVCRTVQEQGLHPYHVQRVQAQLPTPILSSKNPGNTHTNHHKFGV
jgi:hypothetical protein